MYDFKKEKIDWNRHKYTEKTKSSRQILKLVDQLVKSNDLEKALAEVKKAREIDPKNLYAFAYEERIQELFIQQRRKKTVATENLKNTNVSGKVLNPYNMNDHILSNTADGYGMKVPALYDEFKKAGLRSADSTEPVKVKRASKEALETYKQALLLVWSDGKKTEEEIYELQDLRQSLCITAEENEFLDKQAKLECYIFLLKHLLHSHASQSEMEESLAELRKSFDMSSSDQDLIDANLGVLKEQKKKKQKIVVVDDDQQILTLMKATLVQAKYEVAGFSTSDDAYEFLKKENIDLILCDISLETSTMNGFLFYERIKELRHLQQVPFIFITGLNDAVLMRAGKEIGVDDFLVKPIHRENLIATVHGKIKRYEQLRLLSRL